MRLALPTLNASEQFVTASDKAFFKTLFYSGDRAGSLGQVKTAETARFPDYSGFLINYIWGKTLRDGASNLFGLRRHPKSTPRPVRAKEEYVTLADLLTHVGWSSPATAEDNRKLANVNNAGAPADLLAQDSPAVTEVADLYSRYDSLKDFIIAFPSLAPSPQKRPLSQFFPRRGIGLGWGSIYSGLKGFTTLNQLSIRTRSRSVCICSCDFCGLSYLA